MKNNSNRAGAVTKATGVSCSTAAAGTISGASSTVTEKELSKESQVAQQQLKLSQGPQVAQLQQEQSQEQQVAQLQQELSQEPQIAQLQLKLSQEA